MEGRRDHGGGNYPKPLDKPLEMAVERENMKKKTGKLWYKDGLMGTSSKQLRYFPASYCMFDERMVITAFWVETSENRLSIPNIQE